MPRLCAFVYPAFAGLPLGDEEHETTAECVNPVQGGGKYCPEHYYGRPHPRTKLCPTCLGRGIIGAKSSELYETTQLVRALRGDNA